MIVRADLDAKAPPLTKIAVINLKGNGPGPSACPYCGHVGRPLLSLLLPTPRRAIMLCLRCEKRYEAKVESRY